MPTLLIYFFSCSIMFPSQKFSSKGKYVINLCLLTNIFSHVISSGKQLRDKKGKGYLSFLHILNSAWPCPTPTHLQTCSLFHSSKLVGTLARERKKKHHGKKGLKIRAEGCGEFHTQSLFVVNGKQKTGIKAIKG